MEKIKIAVIGLGYVGLPLAIEFGKKYPTLGFDINHRRVQELNEGKDWRGEMLNENLKASVNLTLTNNPMDLKGHNVFIVAVPTPLNKNKHPDLTPLFEASKSIGKVLKKNDVVIYESTVYPGQQKKTVFLFWKKQVD